MKRYARVGTAMGGIAAKAAGRRLIGRRTDVAAEALALKTVLGALKGPLMKVGQILSTVPDMLPPEYTTELAHLQTNAPSMGWAFVRRRMAAELGPDWQSRFRAFEPVAAAAASLGQVHRATSRDGHALACKIQYPDMGAAVEADLAQLKVAFALYRRFDRAIEPARIHEELSARLREELDYRREARNMRLYDAMLHPEKKVHVPEPVAALSTGRLLTMNWLEGKPLKSFVDAPLKLRNTVAYNMFRAWYVPFYGYGVIHGDPHLGNYTIRPDGDINLLDFGCIRVFKPSFIRAVIDLYRALRDGDEDLAVSAYRTWGFKNLDRKLIAILSQWARFLYAPLMEDKAQKIQDTGDTAFGARVAGKVHRELREFGGVMPPREFVLMDRAAVGLGSVFTHLHAEINWHRLFHDLIDGFDEKALGERQRKMLARFDIPPAD
ncbi:MAG: AarF/ABC1/UbiB kinase family protein [Rhodospirillales bacterium]|nr:AarF/ABC1/UbiB kinase family protein [Rhodospirillales bacterium]MSP79458.1 AarF/ABC1/UbiB kinase family protein [Rhodospirillales bacterium]